MKKVVALLLAIALTAAVSIGATLAYLTDTDEDVNVMTLGKVKIDQLEYERVDTETENEDATVQEFHDNKPLLPSVVEDNFDWTTGDSYVNWDQIGGEGSDEIWDPAKINNEVDKMVFIKNKGDYDAYVRSVIAFEAGNYTTLDEFLKMVHLNINTEDYTWEWVETPTTIGEGKYFVAVATYKDILQPGKLTPPSLLQIALDPSATNEDVGAFGDTYQVLVKSQGIQAQGFTDGDTALNEGFGKIAENIPWENDAPIKGIDLRTALHFLDGDRAGTQITNKVRTVTFGLNKDYADKVDGLEGTLVDEEQDVPVYAYYVPNDANYDVYFLANDDIYTPKNSHALFFDEDKQITMSALTAVYTENMNVSRTVDMSHMFNKCTALAEMDTSRWNTESATDMGYMFYSCESLPQIDGSNWDMADVTNTKCMFANAKKLRSVDATGWDVSKVVDAYGMFASTYALTEIKGTGDWQFKSLDNAGAMFQNAKVLPALDTTGWNLGQLTNARNMFRNCYALKTITGTQYWDLSNILDMTCTFAFCKVLTDLDVSTWRTSNCTIMKETFMDCEALTTLDVSEWDVSSVTSFAGMFRDADQNKGHMTLQNLDLSKWDTSNAVNMEFMFYGCGSMKTVDLSGWNISKNERLSHMFADCYDLESVNFTGWDTHNVMTLDGMFNHCTSIKTIDLSMFDTSNVKEFSQMFEICESLETIYGLETFDTSNGQDFSEMFSGCTSLTQLDLSSFDTTNANAAYINTLGCKTWMFLSMFDSMVNLEKITLSEKFSFDGDGSASNYYKLVMPAAYGVEGWDGHWYDAKGNAYAPSEIPEEVAATYYAVKPATTGN